MSSIGVSAMPEKKQRSSTAKFPLVVYNFVSCLLWGIHLARVVKFLFQSNNSSVKLFYSETEWFLTITQSCAVIEIFNSLFKIVRSPLVTTAAQVFSRLLIVIGSFQMMPAIKHVIGAEYLTLSLAWGITEVVRYAFYGLNLVNVKSKTVVFLRYNMFPLLYPLGVTSELIVLYKTMSISESYVVKVVYVLSMLAYIPGFPVLFSHMWIQRKKAMREMSEKKHGEMSEKKQG